MAVGETVLISTDPDPIVSSLLLRTALRQARDNAKLTQADVGTALHWSAKKVYRLEVGDTPVSRSDAQALTGLYGMDPQRTQELLKLAEAASGPPWWRQYRRIVSPSFGLYLSSERAAETLLSFHPSLVKALVQTEQYAHAILSAKSSPEALPQRVKLRRARREVFERPQPPRATVLLGEAALHNRVGTAQVMREQLLSLREQVHSDDPELGIVPFDRSVYPAMLIGFDIAQIPGAQPTLSIELPPVSRTTQDETMLNDLFLSFFAEIRDRALFGADAAALIDAILDQQARGDSDRQAR